MTGGSGLDSPYVSLLLWAFVPQIITNYLHSWYYSLRFARHSPSIPQQGSARYRKHNRRIYTVVVLSYLLYTLVQFVLALPQNHYSALALSPAGGFTERELKTAFRKASLQHHPDKSDDPRSVEIFMRVREAYEVLQNPEKRFAYDRFGHDIATSKTSKTKAEYTREGIEHIKWFYVGTAAVLLVMNMAGKGQFGRYWRFVATLSLFGLELAMVMRPRNPIPLADTLLSPYFTRQEQIQILHNFSLSFFIALSQVGPVIFDDTESRSVRQLLGRLEEVQKLTHTQAVHTFNAIFEPFREDSAVETVLRRQMEKIAVDAKLSADREYATVHQNARKRMAKSK